MPVSPVTDALISDAKFHSRHDLSQESLPQVAVALKT